MTQKITLSTVSYFAQGNTFTGSLTPPQFVANPLADIFNYRVYCRNSDGENSLAAEHYIGCKCYELTEKEKISSASFDVTRDGILKAEAFLQKAFDEFVKGLDS